MPADALGLEATAWRDRGRHVDLLGEPVFVVDVPAKAEERPPLLVIHGFPTSSIDYAGVVDALAARRRVVLLDLPGFGFSAKPDRPYTMAGQADVVVALTEALGLERFALLTHDMGDTVGGELLARQAEGGWPVEITTRVVTNGSIYIGMAHLTEGQQILLSLPDEQLPEGVGSDPSRLAAALVATLAPGHADVDMLPHAEAACFDGGARLMPRLVRYIEERRTTERRYTGAIETHPSPLHVVWGPEDPIAVRAMPEHLVSVRPDATLTWLDGAGHYPQLEVPDAWLAAVLTALDG
ncbi:MAG TPA: alpha/beta hydrolase [Mycobacteriales bacterium]